MANRKGRATRGTSPHVARNATVSRVPVRPLWTAVGLVALTLFVYAPVRHFQFVNWDDPSYITENPNIQAGLTWRSVKWALTTGYSPYWHPMTWLSHLLDVQLFGLDAGTHHVTSLVIHIANTLLLFAVMRRMTRAAGRSAFVAAIFAAHPLHVESVAWVTERKDVLSTFFWVLTIGAYVGYVTRPQWQRYIAVLALYALALMSKPMVVTLPFILLLLDVWPLRRIATSTDRRVAWGRLIAEKLPLLALAVATSIATVVVQKRVGAVAGLDVLPWPVRAANALVSYVAYVWKTVWPARLAAFYPYHVFSAAQVAGAALALVTMTAVAIRVRDRYPYVLVGWLWFLVALAPVIGLLQAGEQAMADRFMYVPLIGLAIIVAWGVPDLVAHSGIRRHDRVLVPAGALLIVVLCAVAARAQVEHWSDSLALWRHAARATPDSYIAYENLGQALRERGQLDDARVSYRKALNLAPAGSPAYAAVIANALGLISTKQGKMTDAIAEFATAVRLNPQFAEAQSNLGNALASERRFEDAIEHYRAAIRIKPAFTEAQVGLGSALVSQGRAADAIPYYKEALRLDPELAQAHNGLGAALAMEAHDEEAMAEYAEALRLKPDLTTAHFNLAVLLVKHEKFDAAERHLETALSIDPDYEPARRLLLRITSR